MPRLLAAVAAAAFGLAVGDTATPAAKNATGAAPAVAESGGAEARLRGSRTDDGAPAAAAAAEAPPAATAAPVVAERAAQEQTAETPAETPAEAPPTQGARPETEQVAVAAGAGADATPVKINSTGAEGPAIEAGAVAVGTFFWNVHWQCSVAARGATQACKGRAMQRFKELAQGANIVASVELSNGMSEPVTLIPGWTQVNGPCARGYGGDSVALAFEPGWRVEASSGGCLRHDWDTRAFAVARVQPPTPIRGCPSLCVVAVHAPHSRITVGGDVVRAVCGDAAQRCAVAMGDWNVPAGGLHHRWQELVGGGDLSVVAPNERTCCWPEWRHYGLFDHVATNIAGASLAGYYVHPYQILEEHPAEQHKPVFARLSLPGAW